MHKNQDVRQEEILEPSPITLSQSYATLEELKEDLLPHTHSDTSNQALAKTGPTRQRASVTAQSLDQDEYLPGRLSSTDKGEFVSSRSTDQTVLYLAYGSNLASSTFLGMRGIRPLSQLSVIVPDLRLTFDLPGLPYMEPCFAGTHFRHAPTTKKSTNNLSDASEKHTLLSDQERDQDRYKGPLVGVVYEVTLLDYAKIIATEGGGRGYKDIVITCYPFPQNYDPAAPIPEQPSTEPIKAHTLLSPAGMEELRQLESHTKPSDLPSRPPRYAQPSARYLKLITTGAAEHNLPIAYREYLEQIQTYHVTSMRQKIGKGLFITMWAPLFLLMVMLGRVFARPDGRSPEWVGCYADFVTASMWSSYDNVFKRIFGDGERTVER
ncbi:hypothetical protein BJY04DRAFT_8261 [Aspergillus karnatakaensis]|uniref:uncharacterized protein n=1 Tax=Aspergillus karnatakaensis TaxID=1810916 RepID=UPI003CCE01A6